MKKYYILVDCNNFYASCERLFCPRLEKRAIVVLSNNDGCVVARSQEAKQLGIKMGEPYFKIKDLCERLKIVVCSSNYQLYGDLSQRVMRILIGIAEEIQIYSIDEAFLTFPDQMPLKEIFGHCIEVRRLIKKWVGIPVSIGIAPTKTLAKAAGAMAKKNPQGVFCIASRAVHETVLKDFPVGDVWGIGSRFQNRLHALGIRTAWDFQKQDPSAVRKSMGVVGERMLWELRGRSCLPLEKAQPKKSICCSRSFGNVITELDDLAEALSTYVNTACIKVREQHCCAQAICVFAEAIIDSQTGLRQHDSKTASLLAPTNDTSQIITAAKSCLAAIFQKEKRYKKCGIILLDLLPEANVMPDLFLQPLSSKRKRLAEVYDHLNARFGKRTLFYGAMGVNPHWKMRSEQGSGHYTTSWDGLAVAKA